MQTNLVLLFFVLVLSCCVSSSAAAATNQSLPNDELWSAIWLLQYSGRRTDAGAGAGGTGTSVHINASTSDDICNGAYFSCSIDGGHIIKVNMFDNVTFVYDGDLPSNVTSLILPMVQSIDIYVNSSTKYFESVNLLDYLTNLSSLSTLRLYDPRLKMVSTTTTTPFSSLQSLTLGLSSNNNNNNNNNITLSFEELVFPNLTIFGIELGVMTNFTYPETIKRLNIQTNSITPSNISLYYSLLELNINNINQTLLLPSPLPKYLKNVTTTNNSLSGNVPLDLLLNDPFNLNLDLENNMGLTGKLSNDFCYIQSLFIQNTSITAVPDCWGCLASPTTRFSSSLPLPLPSDCKKLIQFDSHDLVSFQGRFTISGNMIGWSDFDSNLKLIYPNKQLEGTIDLDKGLSQQKNYTFLSTGQPIPFNINEVGFKVHSVMVDPYNPEYQAISIAIFYDIVNPLTQYQPSILFGGSICHFIQFDLFSNTTLCTVTSPPNGSNLSIQISNSYQNQTINDPDIVTKHTEIKSYKFDPPYGPFNNLTLYGYFGFNSMDGTLTFTSLEDENVNVGGCTIIQSNQTYIQCEFEKQPITIGPTKLNLNIPNGNYNFAPFYIPAPINIESIIHSIEFPFLILNGYFGKDTQGGKIYINSSSSISSSSYSCIITDSNATYIKCNLSQSPPQGVYIVKVQVADGDAQSTITISSTKITSIQLIPPTFPPTTMILNGYFGVNSNQGLIYINNNTNICTIIKQSNETMIQCTFNSTLLVSGQTNVTVNMQNGNYSSNTILFIPYPSPSNEECMVRTNNCSGHGKCVDGICQCVGLDWYDDCKFKISSDENVKVLVNSSNPTISFTHVSYKLQFDLVAIQELDINNQIIKELHTTNNWNNYTDTSTNNQLKSLEYQLSLTNNNIFNNTNIISTIQVSNNSRTIQFGDESIYIGNNSIKSTVSIKDWPYSTVSESPHLVVLFSTTINNNQTIIGCDGSINQVETFQSFQDSDSIEFIRIISNDIQFFGQFLPFVISDNNKSTYSKIELINTTRINDQQSIALIGIHLPQCQLCLIDPQFVPLEIDLSSQCPSSNSQTSDKKEEEHMSWYFIASIVLMTSGALAILSCFVFKKTDRQIKFIPLTEFEDNSSDSNNNNNTNNPTILRFHRDYNDDEDNNHKDKDD
ncbi:hypothetical protein DFA_02131 [Cavenderia fasciculata]|uniref:EGF-like domain-containing protein n=1 Tax=Cavenderia fasciculata TaxID=261658 RepID=F4PYS8_CACFS|nr:uncharacterized protein DFA_02131 [Cavenderia fasciculata]EGG19344.1 hypothetical protein DFA_02131 [Cavenderia fasciculata]|eukprot:XP_004357615.1 hypothetical protein DFA_02131 [Cavenderia fasciculata]